MVVRLGILCLGNISRQTPAGKAAARRGVAPQRGRLNMQNDVKLLPVVLVQQGNVGDVTCL